MVLYYPPKHVLFYLVESLSPCVKQGHELSTCFTEGCKGSAKEVEPSYSETSHTWTVNQGSSFSSCIRYRRLEASCFTSLCLIHLLLYKAVLSQGLSEWRRTAEKDMIPDCKDVLKKTRFLLSKIS